MNDEQLTAWIASNMPRRFTIARLREVMRAEGVQPPTSCMRWLGDNGFRNSLNFWSRV